MVGPDRQRHGRAHLARVVTGGDQLERRAGIRQRHRERAARQDGVTHVIFLEGINDIGQARENPSPSADDVIAGHRQIIERAHARGLKIYGATLSPFYGAAYYTDVLEAIVALAVEAPAGPPAGTADFLSRLDGGWLSLAYTAPGYDEFAVPDAE